MRSSAALIVACAVLSAASDSPVPINVNIGDEFPTSIETGILQQEKILCELTTPDGETIQFRPQNEGDPEKYILRNFTLFLGCAVDVRVGGKADEGVWTLTYSEISTVATKKLDEKKYKITVNEADDTNVNNETETTTDTPSSTTTPKDITKDRKVEYLEDLFIDTLDTGIHHEVKILYYDFVETESCHIVAPNGDEYILEDISVEGIKVMNNREVACGVELTINEDMIGNWTLFSRDTRLGSPIERRLNFTIYMEELVKAWSERVNIQEGHDLIVRLENPTPFYSTCKLVSPDVNDDRIFQRDLHHFEECGFILNNVQRSDAGLWVISFGERTIYKALITVIVKEAPADNELNLYWEENTSVDMFVGPEDAVYCTVMDPQETVVFNGFGKCHIKLARVTNVHFGGWSMTYGLPGKVSTFSHIFTVDRRRVAESPRVITSVDFPSGDDLLISCGIEFAHPIRNCNFRQPSGNVLVAPEGVGESRYRDREIILKTNVTSTECSLRKSQYESFDDLGLWRCSVDTEAGVFHGFMMVRDIDSNYPKPEPTLHRDRAFINEMEGSTVIMRCFIPHQIKYCYFRAQNGSIFTVSPGAPQPSGFEYAGAGLDSGECGIRFGSLQTTDSGQWSCHVGLDQWGPEQLAVFDVNIESALRVTVQTVVNGALIIRGTVFGKPRLDYCRFVRNDGFGFVTENLPNYTSTTGVGALAWGQCSLQITRPTAVDRRPWTIAAKIAGQDGEVVGTGGRTQGQQSNPPVMYMSLGHMWILVVLLSMAIMLLSLNMTSKRHREWAYSKASNLRYSFRRRTPEAPASRPATGPTSRPVDDPVPSYAQATANNPV